MMKNVFIIVITFLVLAFCADQYSKGIKNAEQVHTVSEEFAGNCYAKTHDKETCRELCYAKSKTDGRDFDVHFCYDAVDKLHYADILEEFEQ